VRVLKNKNKNKNIDIGVAVVSLLRPISFAIAHHSYIKKENHVLIPHELGPASRSSISTSSQATVLLFIPIILS
jgi:hypothetical protein